MAPCLPLKEQVLLQDCFVSPLMSLTPAGALTTAWLMPLRGDALVCTYDLLLPWASGSRGTWGSKPRSQIIQNTLYLHFSIRCPVFTFMHTKKNFMGSFLIDIVQTAENARHITLSPGQRAPILALDLFVRYVVVFLDIISLENSRGWESWITGRTHQMDGNHRLQHFLWYLNYCSYSGSAFSLIPSAFCTWGQAPGKEKGSQQQPHGKEEGNRYMFNITIQPTTTILWPWWEMIPELSRIVPYHRRHCLLCHWLCKSRHEYHRKSDSGAGSRLPAVCT